jgi:5-enolpyruvylshikimate-3-phosphate synthase
MPTVWSSRRASLNGALRSHGDHRLAMATGWRASGAGETVIEGRSREVSYPDFWRDLARAAGDEPKEVAEGRRGSGT